jgi:hypothetical protein
MDRSSRRRARVLLIGMLATLLGACSTGAMPTATPAATSVAGLRPTAMPRPTDPPPAASPVLVDPAPPTAAAEQDGGPGTPEAQPTEQPPAEEPPTVDGQTALTLGRGAGDGNIGANTTLRIGADGSIRVLDSDNRRLLFYDAAGALQREQPLAEADSPLDFIVANSGEIFVLDDAGDTTNGVGPVLRYAADGTLAERIALGEKIFAAAIMLNANNDLFVANGAYYWLIQHDGQALPAEVQPFTARVGSITPRSWAAFVSEGNQESGRATIKISKPDDVANSQMILLVPVDQQFFNIDREMNIYATTAPYFWDSGIDVWRYNSAGVAMGGAHIDTSGCQYDSSDAASRNFYIDQAGSAWVLCLNDAGATINNYHLLDSERQPLPAAASEPADVAWKPGGNFSPG